MSKIVNKVVEVGSLGLVKDVTGADAASDAARDAGVMQSGAALRAGDIQSKGATEAAALQAQGSRLAGDIQARAAEQGQLGLQGQFAQTSQSLQPWMQGGREASAQQQALLGLGGQEAQQAAFQAFEESPGQLFIRKRAQKNLLQNASAIGGLGGGNVRSALVEQGAGFAAQDYANQFNRLGQLSGQGQQAATNVGQFGAQAAANQSNLGLAAGAARASGVQGAKNALASGILGSSGAQAAGQMGSSEALASGLLGQQQAKAQATGQVLQLGGAIAGGLSGMGGTQFGAGGVSGFGGGKAPTSLWGGK